MHRLFASVVVSALFASLIGCGGYSAEESQIKCNLERDANSTCFTDATYDQCLTCYQTCGETCATAESCPAQYICSE